jgi:hypothetical protein
LPARRIKRTEPLVNYSKFHVFTSKQYLGIQHQKVMQKEIANKEREIGRYEKEARTTLRATTIVNANIIKIQRLFERQERTIFNSA